MIQTEKKQIRKYRTIRIILKSILFLLLFIVAVFLLLLTPPVQRVITTKVENYLENKLSTTVEIGKISFDLLGYISLKEIYVEDRRNRIIAVGRTGLWQ